MVPREGGAHPEEDHEEEVDGTSIGKFIIVLRTSTEAVEAGCARVMGFDDPAIREEMRPFE